MTEPGEVARKYPSHISSPDNSDPHVDFAFGVFVSFKRSFVFLLEDTSRTLAAWDSFGPTDARLLSTHPLAE